MTIDKETIERYELLEELIAIPEPFGFSIPNMCVIEQLTLTGKEYSFYYNNRDNTFLRCFYDKFKKKVTQFKISKYRQPALEQDFTRWERILKDLRARIEEKNQGVISPHDAEYESFLAKATELTNTTKQVAEEISILEQKDEVKQALHTIEEQIQIIQTKVEEQKEKNLQTIVNRIQNKTNKEGVV